jgi:hypothetical protein
LGAEAFVFGFEVGDALAHGGGERDDLFFCVAWGDELGAVPIEGFDVDDDGSFDGGVVCGGVELLDEVGGFGAFVDGGAAEDFEASLGGVVHEDEGYAVVVLQVAGGDVLLVAAEVGEGDGAVVEDVDEAGRAAAMLDVRPAGFAGGGHVEGVAGGEEVALGFGETVAGLAGLLDAGVGGTAAVEPLLLLDEGGEGYFGEALAHLDRLGCAEVEGRSTPGCSFTQIRLRLVGCGICGV